MTITREEIEMIGMTPNTTGVCPEHIKGKWVQIFIRGHQHKFVSKQPENHTWSLDYFINVTAYRLLEVGTCRNGDPIIFGKFYDLEHAEGLKVIGHVPKDNLPIKGMYDCGKFRSCKKEDFLSLHRPKQEPQHHLMMSYKDD